MNALYRVDEVNKWYAKYKGVKVVFRKPPSKKSSPEYRFPIGWHRANNAFNLVVGG